MRRTLSASIILAVLLPVSRLLAQQPTAADLIRRLYETYAWETTDTLDGRSPLFAASPAVMRAFLDSSLIRAVMVDRACMKQSQGICNVDFDPMWASQDPVGATSKVFDTADPAVVRVELQYKSEPEPIVITYHLRPTSAGWRITDLGTKDWPSLKKLLLSPAP
jgi:ABC-type transporter MlaC component